MDTKELRAKAEAVACRFPFQHEPHSCDCTPSKLSRDIARFNANAASRKEMARGSTLALYLILAVSVAVVGLIGFGGAAVVDQGIQNWKNTRVAHVEP